MRAALAGLAVLAAVAAGCGDAVVIISVNTGIIASAPSCGSGGGQFDLQNQAGLLLLVVINSSTVILNTAGHPAHCSDLTAGARVQVRGPQQGRQITARSVNLE